MTAITLPKYEVFALRYGTMQQRTGRDNFLVTADAHDGPMPMDYFVWLIRGNGRQYLVDTGFNAQAALARKRTFLRCPIEALQAVRVHTARGWVVLASDATHYYANIDNESPFPVVHDVGAMLAGYRKLLAHAESPHHLVPGHDPLVRARYPHWGDSNGEIVALHLEPSQ